MTIEIRTGRGVVYFWTAVTFPGHPMRDDYTWVQRVYR